jgi:hypothetical protein
LPTATIENGTTSRERWVLGTLATIGPKLAGQVRRVTLCVRG